MAKSNIKRIKTNFKNIIDVITGEKTYGAVYGLLMTAEGIAKTMTPVDTSNLINSYTSPRIEERADQVVGTIGNTAKYAGWVHNMPGKLDGEPRAHFGKTREGVEFGGGSLQGNYWDPSGEPQFVTKAIKETLPHMKRIVKEAYKP